MTNPSNHPAHQLHMPIEPTHENGVLIETQVWTVVEYNTQETLPHCGVYGSKEAALAYVETLLTDLYEDDDEYEGTKQIDQWTTGPNQETVVYAPVFVGGEEYDVPSYFLTRHA